MKNFIAQQVSSLQQSIETLATFGDAKLTVLDKAIVVGMIVLSFLCGFAIMGTVLQMFS
jgi:hypothetical protein